MNISGGRLSFDAYIKDSDFKKQIDAMEQRISGLTDTSRKEAKKMDAIFSTLAKSAAAFFTVSQAQNFVGEMIKVRSEFQQLEIAFTTMLGSKEKADRLTKDLIQFAATTPFGMKDTANAAKQLLAYGSAAETVTDELRMLGDVAAGTSQPIGDLVYLYGTLRTQGRAYTQDIRQFAGRGIPIYKELAKVLKTNEAEVNNLVSAGRVGFAEIEQAFRNMTAEGSMFGGLMEKQSKTIAGDLERLGDSIEQMYNEIGQSSEGIIGNTIQGLAYLVENYKAVLDILTGLILTYGAYRAAILATAVAQNIAAASAQGLIFTYLLQYQRVVLLEKAQKLLNRTMLANPYVLAATALAGLSVILWKVTSHLSNAEKAQERLNTILKESNDSVAEQEIRLKELIKVASDENRSKREREKAMREINKISPEYLGHLNLQNIATKEGTEATLAYVEALRQRAFEEAAFNERVAIERERLRVERDGADLNWAQRAGMWVYGITGGNSKAMKDAAKKDAIAALDAREKALDEELKKRNGNQNNNDKEDPFVSVKDRLAQINKEIKATEESLKNALMPGAKYDKTQIEQLQDSLKNLRDERDLLMGKSKEGDKALREIEQWGEKKLEILRRINDQEEELRISMLTQDEQEIERAKAFYSELRKIIEDHNKNAPKGQQIGAGVLTRIDDLEARELGYLTSEQQVQKDLDNIKKLENASAQLIAVTRKVNELESRRDASGFGLTPAQESELRQYKEFQEKLKEEQNAGMRELLATLISYETQREQLIKEYQEKRKEIEAVGNAENLAVFDQQHREALASIDDENVQKLEAYKDLFGGIEHLTDAMARRVIANAKSLVASLLSSGKISQELADEITNKIAETQNALDERLPERLDRLAAAFDHMAYSIGDLNGGLGDTLSLLSLAIRSVNQVKSGFKDLKSGIANYQANKAGGGGGILGSISAIAGVAGPAGQIVSAVTSVVSGIVNIFKASRESAKQAKKEMEEYASSVSAGEREHARVLRERERTQKNINDLTKEEIELRQQLLEKQKSTAQSEFDALLKKIQKEGQQIIGQGTTKSGGFLGIGRKTKVVDITSGVGSFEYDDLERLYNSNKLTESTKKLFEELRKIKDELKEIDKATLETFDFIADQMSGAISADNISSNIIKGLQDGKRAFADFADDAEEMIKNALLSAMAYTVLDEPLKKLVEQFREDSLDGLDESELQAFRDAYRSIVETGIDAIKDIEKIAGPLGGKSNSGEFAKGIQGITESTAGRLEGEFGGLRLAQLQQLEISKQNNILMSRQLAIQNNQMAELSAIKQNTGRTAENTEKLASIESTLISMNNKIGNIDAIRRGAGI